MTRIVKSLEEKQLLLEDEVGEMIEGKSGVAQGEFERIVLEYNLGYEKGIKVAFEGKEIHSCDEHEAYATSNGKILIYSYIGMGQAEAVHVVFNNFEEVAGEIDQEGEAAYPVELLSAIAKHFGEKYVEELDI